jgi:hypothetical protein
VIEAVDQLIIRPGFPEFRTIKQAEATLRVPRAHEAAG